MPKKKVAKDKKTVSVHTCFSLDLGEELPSLCACRRKITLFQAKRWVRTGLSEWIAVGKRTFHDKICMINGSAQRTPRAATIDKAHIERAYTSDHGLEDRVRIETYGQINKEELAKLVRVVPSYEFDDGFDLDYGRSILYIPGDCRTPGGIGKWVQKQTTIS
jgi:hypothetical protein